MNAVAYVRISTKDQSQYSLEYQERNVREYCQQNSLNLLHLFNDDGESSYTFNRPSWKALETFIKENRSVQFLVIYEYDRFSRNMSEADLKFKELEKKYGIKVLSTTDAIDTDFSDPSAWMMRTFKLMIAESELHRIRARTKSGMVQAAMSGRYVSKAPYGYLNAKDEQGKPILLIDEEKSFVAKLIFKEYLKGLSIEEVRRLANTYGYNQKGNSAIRELLSNPVYAGLLRIPAHKGKAETYGKGLHKGLITENEFWKVQQRLNEKRIVVHRKEEVPLRGVLRCHICGRLLTAGNSKGRNKYYWYYVCDTHRINLPAAKLHRQLNEILDTFSFSEEDIAWYKEELSKEIAEMLSTKSETISRTQKALRAITDKIEEAEERYLLGNVSKAVFERLKIKLTGQKIDLQKRLYELDADSEEYFKRIVELLNVLKDVRGLLDKETIHVKQQFLNMVFDNGLSHDGESYRTAYIDDIFAHNVLELKEKGLIKIDQSYQISAISPLSAPQRSSVESIYNRLVAFADLFGIAS